MRYLLASNNTLIVRGPISLRLLRGRSRILGAPLEQGRRIVVRKEKQLPIEAVTETEVEILLGELGKILEIMGSSIPASWNAAVEAIAEMSGGKIVIIGVSDVGKSTLCTYLINQLLDRGLTLRVVDADIGQTDLGPPTTVGSSTPSRFIFSLVDLNPEALIFLGHTSPSQVEDKLIDAVRRLADQKHEKRAITIINTDGWILDPPAISYKIKMISAIKPDIVLEMSTDSELQPILSGSQARSLKVAAAAEALRRSRIDRREIRTSGYQRFLNGASVRTLPLREVRVLMQDGLTSLRAPFNPKLRNLIVGLLNEKGYLLEIGILLELEKDFVRIYSRPTKNVRKIELGYLKLSIDGSEIGYF